MAMLGKHVDFLPKQLRTEKVASGKVAHPSQGLAVAPANLNGPAHGHVPHPHFTKPGESVSPWLQRAPPGYFQDLQGPAVPYEFGGPPTTGRSERCITPAAAGIEPLKKPGTRLENKPDLKKEAQNPECLTGDSAETVERVLTAISSAYLTQQSPQSVLATESILIPSLGSLAHSFGTCHPCHYAHTKRGCHAGKLCGLCHHHHVKERTGAPIYRL
mmetsp:Transcript_3315/g.7838  ORF Transcript_3315/g.7838 Transcript_3315/m.7838 type:complete len:216 (-) Transcript_3315:29-676(-)